MVARAIAGYHRDEKGDWVADLECGHPQHVRHRPPMEERPWVLTDEGRASHLGTKLNCLYCNMPTLPADAEPYKTTQEYTETTIPEGMLRDHRIKAGTWGRIIVREGKLLYSLAEPSGSAWFLRPGIDGIIAPRSAHWVVPHGKVRFVVEFLRAPEPDEDDDQDEDEDLE